MSAALFATRFPDDFRSAVASRMTVLGPFDGPLDQAMTADESASVRVLMTMGTLKADAALMDQFPNLGLICNYGSGHEGTDVAAATARGIVVTNSLGGNAAAVADMAMALLLAASRQIVIADRLVRDGRWAGAVDTPIRMPPVAGLTGRKLGIFGLGMIGDKIARRAEAFEMEVGYFNRSRRDDVPYPYFDSLQALADWADVLVVAARADATNRHIVDKTVLRALGPQGIVINIGRGSLLDDRALVELVRAGELGAAGLDVFETEPNVPAALRELDQVVMSPHIAGGTFEAHARLKTMVLANIDAFLQGKPIPNALQPARPDARSKA